MFQRLIPIGLVTVLWGCGGSSPLTPGGAENATPAGREADREGGDRSTPATKEVEAAIEKLEDADGPDEIRVALAGLEKALQNDPANVDGLVAFWENMREVKTAEGKNDYRMYGRAADLVRRAIQTEKTLRDRPDFREMAADVFYNEACAKSIDKKLAECIAALRLTVSFGWENLEHTAQDADLASVRDTPEYKKFLAEAEKTVEIARQARKAALVDEVVEEMAATKPFEFRFDVEDVTGKRISTAGFSGKILIVDIWGTWCGPCLRELPHFIALHKKFHDQGLEIVGLNSETDDEDLKATATMVREFIEKRELPYPCALLTEELSEKVPDLAALPTTLFFDRAGKLRLRATGYHELAKLEVIVEQLLKEKAE
jgi:thiol-disulfide isomerase/thioredoxin